MNPGQQCNPWVLFICEDDERNLCDQKIIEVRLQQKFKVFSMRKTFAQIATEAVLDPASKQQSIEGREVGLVYYRSGYQAEQYCFPNT